MCGKYFLLVLLSFLRSGSPPHVREIHFELQFRPLLSRITPACAGNTLEFDTKRKEKQDHPRMCGKYLLRLRKVTEQEGSPPHVREIHTSGKIYSPNLGITPACAGNTLKDPSMTLPAI